MSEPLKAHQLDYQSPSTVKRLNFMDYAVAALFSAFAALLLGSLIAAMVVNLVPEKADALRIILLIADAAITIAAGRIVFRQLARWPNSDR